MIRYSLADIERYLDKDVDDTLSTLKDTNEFRYMMMMGLAEEAGEVAGIGKRLIRRNPRDHKSIRKEHLIEELGDVLWYVAGVAKGFNISLDEIWDLNRKKLGERYGNSK